MRLSGRVALITGASGGVGAAIAMRLAEEGAALCLVGRRREALDAIADSARHHSPHVAVYVVDLAQDDQIRELGGALQRDVQGVDILVHAAGAIALGPFAHASVDDFDRQFRTNVRGPYLLTQVVLPMLRSRRGQVVFINSTAGLTARGGSGQYAATKAALKALADSLRDEVNPEGVRVMSLFLGRTATTMQAAVHEAEGKRYQAERLIQPDEIADLLAGMISLGPTVEVTEVRLRPFLKPSEEREPMPRPVS